MRPWLYPPGAHSVSSVLPANLFYDYGAFSYGIVQHDESSAQFSVKTSKFLCGNLSLTPRAGPMIPVRAPGAVGGLFFFVLLLVFV